MSLCISHINKIYYFIFMKSKNIVAYLAVAITVISALSLSGHVHAQTNSSSNQTGSQQQNVTMNINAQALVKTDIFDLKSTLENAKIAIVEGKFKGALKDVRDVETQLLLTEPSPGKLLSKMHKATNAIARSDVEKSMNLLTNIQVDILKAENQILKTMILNPEAIQQFVNIEVINEDYEERK